MVKCNTQLPFKLYYSEQHREFKTGTSRMFAHNSGHICIKLMVCAAEKFNCICHMTTKVSLLYYILFLSCFYISKFKAYILQSLLKQASFMSKFTYCLLIQLSVAIMSIVSLYTIPYCTRTYHNVITSHSHSSTLFYENEAKNNCFVKSSWVKHFMRANLFYTVEILNF